MANTTDKSILTAAGKALLAQLNAEEKPLIIDKMIFANVPNRPEYPQPDDVVPTDHIVHQEQVEQRGRLSADSVIYSTTLTSGVGPFEFNWTGAYCSEYGVLVTIDHHALTPKTADQPGVAGNTLVRSVVLEYKDIAEITNITVDASSWQYNATPRMKKMDDDVAQAIIDQNGKDWFIDDGFLVTPQASAFNIKAGAGYVSGNRVTLEFDRSVQVPNKPSFIYIDAHREGTPTGEQVTLFNFVVTAEEKDDYTDANEVKHFVCKIAQVLGDGTVSDLRPEGESASRAYVKKEALNTSEADTNTKQLRVSLSQFEYETVSIDGQNAILIEEVNKLYRILPPPKTKKTVESIDLSELKIHYSDGTFSYLGTPEFAARKSTNALWMGDFQCWQEAPAFRTELTHRRQVCDGWTIARENYSDRNINVLQTIGQGMSVAARVQRIKGTVETEAAYFVANLARVETESLRGQLCCFGVVIDRGKDFSGGSVTATLQYSLEPEQAIIRADGRYTSGHEDLISQEIELVSDSATMVAYGVIPSRAVQVSVNIKITFNGVAKENDFVVLSNVTIASCMYENVVRRKYSDVIAKARERFWTTYPIGAGVGSMTKAGQVKCVAISSHATRAIMKRIEFPRMVVPPTVYVYSSGDGKDMKLWDLDNSERINAMIEDISDCGATIRNNGVISESAMVGFHVIVRAQL